MKIIIVHYIGTRDENSIELINSYSQKLSLVENDKEYKHYIISDPNSNSIKIDCINPKLVSGDEYQKIMDRLEYISKQIEEKG